MKWMRIYTKIKLKIMLKCKIVKINFYLLNLLNYTLNEIILS